MNMYKYMKTYIFLNIEMNVLMYIHIYVYSQLWFLYRSARHRVHLVHHRRERIAQPEPISVSYIDITDRHYMYMFSPQRGSKSPSSIALICTTRLRIPASTSTNQVTDIRDLITRR